jgi:hypothetical protein
MGTGPRALVTAPPNGAPRVGLLASANLVKESDDRWMNGFEWDPETCGTPGDFTITDPCDSESKPVAASSANLAYEPYVMHAGDRCSPFELARDWQGRARRLLQACESSIIAAELWTGDKANAEDWPNMSFRRTSADVLSAAAGVDRADALACLEQYLAECSCGQRGMIHATRHVVTAWARDGMVRREAGLILTIHDTIVVPDAGYPGTAPVGTTDLALVSWAYATGIVDVRLGPVEVLPEDIKEAIDRSTNTVEYRAERMAAATFNPCCLGAIGVQVAACLTVEAS